MAQVSSSDVFPSLREIETDASGDLQEILSANGAFGSLVYTASAGNTATIQAVTEGVAGNNIKIKVTENSGLNNNEVAVTDDPNVTGVKVIDVKFKDALVNSIAGTPDSVEYNNNFSISRKVNGAGTVQLHVIANVDNGYAQQAVMTRPNFTVTKNVAGAFTGSVALSENTGVADTVSIVGSDITIELQNAANASTIQGIVDLLNNDATFSADYTAAVVASNGGNQGSAFAAVSFTGGQDDQDEVKIHAADSDISVCLVDSIGAYDNAAVYSLITDGTASWATNFSGGSAIFDVAITDAAQNASPAISGSFNLSGGSDPSGQTGSLSDIKSLVDNNAEASALVSVTISGDGSVLPVVMSESQLSGGLDATISDLDANSKYIMIKRDDIYELESGESGDARKIVWGVLDAYTSHVTGLSVEQQPENFIVTRGTPSLSIDGAGTRVRQAYSVQAFYASGDWDLEDETSV